MFQVSDFLKKLYHLLCIQLIWPFYHNVHCWRVVSSKSFRSLFCEMCFVVSTMLLIVRSSFRVAQYLENLRGRVARVTTYILAVARVTLCLHLVNNSLPVLLSLAVYPNCGDL